MLPVPSGAKTIFIVSSSFGVPGSIRVESGDTRTSLSKIDSFCDILWFQDLFKLSTLNLSVWLNNTCLINRKAPMTRLVTLKPSDYQSVCQG